MKYFCSLLLIAACFPPGVRAVDFVQDIQPILEQHCLDCHNAEERKGGLVLTSEKWARSSTDSGAIVLEPADKSELMRRLTTEDESERMPSKGDALTAEQIRLMDEWVRSGARWPEGFVDEAIHWAYVKPVRPEVPAGRSAVDYFVSEAQATRGLKPSPRAEAARLLRRVSLDLTGLPPSLEQVEAFERGATSYEAAVDALLSSPRFGEHWARQWLDLARYADSNGFQADQLRDSWGFRDWVINALNADMPFDQFSIEQLAGDMLPDATTEQKIATGFHRTVTCNVEAGVHPEANRHDQVFDRVNTTGLVWLGTTLECAQCHNHKYDPISQKEYYALFSFFNNTPLEVDNKGKGVSYDFTGPFMDLPLPPEEKEKCDTLRAEMDVLAEEMTAVQRGMEAAQKSWEAEVLAAVKEKPRYEILSIEDIASTGSEEFVWQEDGSVLATGTVPSTVIYTFKAQAKVDGVRAIKLSAMTDPALPGKGPGRGDPVRNNFVLNEFEVYASSSEKERGHRVSLSDAKADFSQSGWDVSKAIDGNRKTGWAIAPEFSKPHWAVFLLEKPLPANTPFLTIVLDQNFGRGRVLGRVRLSVTNSNPDLDDIPEEVMAALMKNTSRSKKEQKALDDYYAKKNPEVLALKRKQDKLARELEGVKVPQTLVMVELDKPRETRMLIRGDYSNKGMKVAAGTPEVLHAWDEAFPKNRLGFAQWLMSAENPLTARVTVNRWWGQLFGYGLVKTEEDFGAKCEAPTHPELLDWLAVEFVEGGWSMKHMLKLMVMSETYQQDTRLSPEQLEADPQNRFLARGPRHRMTAEMIRDNALAVSGLLSTRMAGPPVYPPQPDGLWRQTGRNEPKYIVAQDENRFRRGIYIIWRRAAPYASFVNFDGTDRSACTPKRSRTNTPLQALTLLNDETYVEMALALAQKVLKHDGEDLAAYAFKRCLARDATVVELKELREYYAEELARYNADPKLAAALINGAKGVKVDNKVDPVKLAAWQSVASVLLNLDETITK